MNIMKAIRPLAALAVLLAWGLPASAQTTQYAYVVTSCGALPAAYTASTVAKPQYGAIVVDINGNLCGGVTISGGTVTATQQTGTTTEAKVTIAVTNTYQQALAASATRKGCTIQNNGTHIGYVFFGSVPADTTTSFQLQPGQPISCSGGSVLLTDAVQITGTAGDIFVVANQ